MISANTDTPLSLDISKSIFYDTYISDPELNELKSIALQNSLSGLYLRTIAWRVWLGVLPTPVNPECIEEHEDINLRIQKDIDRLFNMYDYFTNKEFRIIITRMLYIFARENPNINYQQGLHELISLFYRCIDFDLSEQVRIKWTNSMSFPTSYLNVVELLIDRNYIEHDTRETSAIQLKCDVLFEQINNIDKKYYDVLISHDVIPSVFGIRWIKMIFAREYHIDDVIELWDSIFAYGNQLKLIDGIFLAMIMYVKNDVIERDDPSYTLRRLMKYPPVIALHSMILTAIKLCGGKITCGTPANESKTLNPVRLKRERRKAVKDKSLIETNQSKKHIITIPNIINDAEQFEEHFVDSTTISINKKSLMMAYDKLLNLAGRTTVDHDELRAIQQNILSVMNSL
ncbi:Rab GTPase activating protein [Entamoeba marina]